MQVTDSKARIRFASLIAGPDIPLAEAALAIAQEEYPALDVTPYLARIDTLAGRVANLMRAGRRTAASTIRALRLVFAMEGFRGNEDQYYDPRNSFLNEVLDRKLGIPISLSILYLEVARRVGLELKGVAFPGHFLVKLVTQETEIFLDPFHGGEVLGADDCKDRFRAILADRQFDSRFLESVGPRQILSRMLYNLKKVYVDQGDDVRALWVIDRLLMLSPGAMEERRDRGLVSARLGGIGAAVQDLTAYLERSPRAPDADEVASLVEELRGRQQYLN